MNSFHIRQSFLNFFAKNGHTIVSSSSLIPAEDPTLLFTNAGMNQFKDLFLGQEKRSYTRATTSQKCVRAGGKHNDLDQVGFTARHLTFFEMLGNFSFGDYFKKEALPLAWEFLTKHMLLTAEKLHVTIYKTDDEAFDVWNKIVGIPANRITRLGEKDNFWQMGDTGPCGPCSEIYIDRGIEKGCKQSTCAPGCDCDRFMEIWNNVFMQYERHADGSLHPLKQTGVDTGMGLERLCAVIQGVDTVFDTDLFAPIIKKIELLTHHLYAQENEKTKAAFHVLADHVRSCSLLIADGCSPSNEGRGYVLRKIIRRAALFAQKLTDDQQIFSKLAQELISFMSPVYPELTVNKKLIISVLDNEIARFTNNLSQGQVIFEKYLEENKKEKLSILTGPQVFKLYDTYGFPPEITGVLAHEHNFTIDMTSFEIEMKKQQDQSGKKQASSKDSLVVADDMSTNFVGYDTIENESTIQFIQINAQENTAWIVAKECPFYVECGGQVGDTGWVVINNKTYPITELKKNGAISTPAIAIKISLTSTDGIIHKDICVGARIRCLVDNYARLNTTKNHTAAHLLQAALVKICGPQVKQAGSQVTPYNFRFDFTHHQALSHKDIEQVELLVNQKIQENITTAVFTTTLEQAKQTGALAFFGEKYNPECVRVIQIPGFSVELCGGTHVSNTGIIGCFKIVSETALATGTRRIVAVTGNAAINLFQQTHTIVKNLSEVFKAKAEDICDAITKLQQSHQKSLIEIKNLKKQLIHANIASIAKDMILIGKIHFLYFETENMGNEELKMICQELEKTSPGFYFLVNKDSTNNTCSFLGFVSKCFHNLIDAKLCFDTLKKTHTTLRGGGSISMIQGSGILQKNLKDDIMNWLKERCI